MANGDKEPLTVMYASATGTIQRLADQLVADLCAREANVSIINMKTLAKPYSIPRGTIVYMTCTFFAGEHPPASKEFIAWLQTLNPSLQPFRDVKFAVFGIGSKNYTTFCAASRETDKHIESFGGTRILDAVHLDRDEFKSDDSTYIQWKKDLFKVLGLPEKPVISTDKVIVTKNTSLPDKWICNAYPLGYKRGTMSKIKMLSDGKVDGVVRLYEITNPCMKYEAGGHCAILPRNRLEDIKALLAKKYIWLDPECKVPAEASDIVVVEQAKWVRSVVNAILPFGRPIYVLDLLSQYLDFSTVIDFNSFKALVPYITDGTQYRQALHMLDDPALFRSVFLDTKLNMIDVFTKFSSFKVPMHALIECMPAMAHRMYSIASAPSYIGENRLQLIISDVDFECETLNKTIEKRPGLSTGYLSRLQEGNEVFFQTFSSPVKCGDEFRGVPSITVGLGTGLAPCGSRLQHRLAFRLEQLKQAGPGGFIQPLDPYMTFIGLRRESDLKELIDELKDFVRKGIATIFVAFSREEKEREWFEITPDGADGQALMDTDKTAFCAEYKCHVTNLMGEYANKIRSFVTSKDTCVITYCGKAGKVPHEIEGVILQSLIDSGMAEEDARARWEKLRADQNLIFEAW